MSGGGALLLNRSGTKPNDVGRISEIKRIYNFRLFCGLVEEFTVLEYSGKEKQLDAQLILHIFCQPLHISGVSRPIIRRYNRMYTTIGTYYSFEMTVCCPGWIEFQFNQDNRQSAKKNKY
jgi:hypothetical protein